MFPVSARLSLSLADGQEVATVRRRRRGRFQVVVRGTEAGLVRRRADRYYIQSMLGSLAAAGSVTVGRYSINRDGQALAMVSRQSTEDVQPIQTISVEIADGDDVILLGMVLAVEAVRYEHAGSQFNPRALLDVPEHLLNPVNWLAALFDQ